MLRENTHTKRKKNSLTNVLYGAGKIDSECFHTLAMLIKTCKA
jgi:hypothetical protein